MCIKRQFEKLKNRPKQNIKKKKKNAYQNNFNINQAGFETKCNTKKNKNLISRQHTNCHYLSSPFPYKNDQEIFKRVFKGLFFFFFNYRFNILLQHAAARSFVYYYWGLYNL